MSWILKTENIRCLLTLTLFCPYRFILWIAHLVFDQALGIDSGLNSIFFVASICFVVIESIQNEELGDWGQVLE